MLDNYSLGYIKKLYSLRNVGIIVVMTESCLFFKTIFSCLVFQNVHCVLAEKKNVAYSRKQAL